MDPDYRECPHNCEYCYESQEYKIFNISEIVRNDVKIMDMNLLCKKECIGISKYLSEQRVHERIVCYELVCGVGYRFLNKEIAGLLKLLHFPKIRIVWDGFFTEQKRLKNAVGLLKVPALEAVISWFPWDTTGRFRLNQI